MVSVVILGAIALLLRAVDSFYYRDSARILRLLRLSDDGTKPRGEVYYQPLDPIFAVLPFVWSWMDICAAALLCAWAQNMWVDALVVVFAGSRARALQEASHIAVHYGLCRSKAFQWELSNVLFQFPFFKPDMHHRYIFHVEDHHRHANEPERDPNLARFRRLGLVPGITRQRFLIKLVHPFTPSGVKETLWSLPTNARLNRSAAHGWVRLLCVATVVAGLYWAAGVRGVLAAYLLPLLTIYPFFSWISVLAEHRWFVQCAEPDRRLREYVVGRPTDYPGVSGWFIKHWIFPATDHYHLVHSLYPFLRWNYMPALDRALKRSEPRYCTYRSEQLFFRRGERPSALSELMERLTEASAQPQPVRSTANG